jgi:hypothetical protein
LCDIYFVFSGVVVIFIVLFVVRLLSLPSFVTLFG